MAMSGDDFEQAIRQAVIAQAVQKLTFTPYGWPLEEDEVSAQIAELNDFNKLDQIMGHEGMVDLVRNRRLTLAQVGEYSSRQMEGAHLFFLRDNSGSGREFTHQELIQQLRDLNNDDIVHKVYHSKGGGLFSLVKHREVTFSDLGKYNEDELTSINIFAHQILAGEMSLANAAKIPAETALASDEFRVKQVMERPMSEVVRSLEEFLAQDPWNKPEASKEEKTRKAYQAVQRALFNFDEAPEMQLLEKAAPNPRVDAIARSIEYAIDKGRAIETPRDFVQNMNEYLREHKMTHQLLEASAAREALGIKPGDSKYGEFITPEKPIVQISPPPRQNSGKNTLGG